MGKITKRQNEILDVIKLFITTKKYPPTTREICELTGLKSSSTVHGHLERLKKEGIIDWEESKPRTLRICHNENQ
ncbi:transcriptional regulator [Desertibacillus haloalkaliphilus]|uniref:LexA family protein n=1 Tax=Desertibacillus haloalkaliphilus TaxID=1328930 RepID=UPI001C27A027|nr:transcriptional regulator [Desertibacillus haloalkaliphilus]MBU8908474.1 transcriptional regulator [Desertibacillus haloalkaliphilus]